MIARRNLRLCTKDCMCLYVCPTGATDTEDSIIDVKKCIGCGKCAEACPSNAITMSPDGYPAQQRKEAAVTGALNVMSARKAEEEKIASQIAESAEGEGLRRLMKAVRMSSRLVSEDIFREAGYMLPQSANSHRVLEVLLEDPPEGFPVEAAKALLASIPCNEQRNDLRG